MRLCIIYIVWDDYFLLKYSIENIKSLVDGIIVVYSNTSNYGELSTIPDYALPGYVNGYNWEPDLKLSPLVNETDKRNFGLNKAKQAGYTHFLVCDSDEFYKHDEFLKIKEKVTSNNIDGIVCPSVVYFRSPKLSIGRDVTLVPHIHKLTPDIIHQFNRSYPYAWINRQIRIDPSRSLNITSGVEYTEEIELHHFSWCRKDYEKKIRNSTARDNITRSTIMNDLLQAKTGYFCEFYRKPLVASTVDFGIPDVFQSIQSSS